MFAPSGARLEPVRFEFALVPSGDQIWHVRRMKWASGLSDTYEISLELVCDDVNAPVDEMLGASCELLIERGDSLHTAHGIICEVDDVGPDQDRLHASLRVVPALELLAHRIDTRIFQGLTAIDILSDVLGEALGAYDREVDASSYIVREYHRRDYCTQFRESTLDFCRRLMEEEGIAFCFMPDDHNHREKLILIDDNDGYPQLEFVGHDEVPIIENNPEEADCESIRGLRWRQRRRINMVSGRAYNFKNASAFDEYDDSEQDDHNHQPSEQYLHDRRRQITDDPVDDPKAESFDGAALPQRQQLVEQVLQAHRAETKTGHGHGNVTGFRPGAWFRLGEHHRPDLDGSSFLLVRVDHEAQCGDGGHATYTNEFTVIPVEQVFRPQPRIPRPKVYGSQLAKVVGPAGQEIHTDKFGRIKIQFHHDRRQPTNDTASCWVRVVQPWAGPQWGSFFIPRVGMEVMVQFVDGNPDSPVVVGSVYNSDNMPPYPMPDEKTKSTIKSSSSQGGNGYNELTFEDAAGAEQIIIHAQKDLDETVENDHSTTVHANQTNSVDGNQSVSVGGNQSISVSGDHSETITGKATVTVHKVRDTTIDQDNLLKIGGSHTVKVDGDSTIEVLGKRSLTVTKATTQLFKNGLGTKILAADDTLSVAQNRKVDISGMHTVTVTGKYSLTQGKTENMTLDGSVHIQSAKAITITNEKCSVKIDDGKLSLKATDLISLTCGDASIKLSSDGTIAIKGTTKVGIDGGGAVSEWSASGVTMKGNMLDLTADAVAKLNGTMVKIN